MGISYVFLFWGGGGFPMKTWTPATQPTQWKNPRKVDVFSGGDLLEAVEKSYAERKQLPEGWVAVVFRQACEGGERWKFLEKLDEAENRWNLQ